MDGPPGRGPKFVKVGRSSDLVPENAVAEATRQLPLSEVVIKNTF